MDESRKRDAEQKRQSDDRLEALLVQISDQIDDARRDKRQDDFSILRLFGALLQMLAIVAGIWGTVSLLNEQSEAATARIALACLLQMASLTAVVTDRLR